MTDDSTMERFGEAVERKKQESKEASEAAHEQNPSGGEIQGDQPSLIEHGRPQDERDERKKNAGKGKKTADKWNQ
jgi:hypothetical protein